MRYALLLPILLSACGGGSDPVATMASAPAPIASVSAATPAIATPAIVNQSAGGLWVSPSSTASPPSESTLFVAETGEFFYSMVFEGRIVVSGNLAVTGSNITGAETVIDETDLYGGSPYPDIFNGLKAQAVGGMLQQYPVTGTVQQQSVIALTDSAGVGETCTQTTCVDGGTTTWTFSQLYMQPSSLSAIAGTWGGLGPAADTPGVLTISANGIMYEQDPGSSCVINGQVSLIDPAYNAYAVTFTYSNCVAVSDDWTFLNGQHVHLFGYITGTQLVLGGSVGMIAVNRE